MNMAPQPTYNRITHDCESEPTDAYWVCLQPRCHSRSTFNTTDPTTAIKNARMHTERTGHPTSVTSTMRTVSVFRRTEDGDDTAKGA